MAKISDLRDLLRMRYLNYINTKYPNLLFLFLLPGDKLYVCVAADVAEDPLHDAPLAEVYSIGELVGDPGPWPQSRPLAPPKLPARPTPHIRREYFANIGKRKKVT